MISLIIGLGNPGRKYEGTRHNVGFEVVDLIAARFDKKFQQSHPDYTSTTIRHKNEQVVLVKPFTFMNLSGTVAALLLHRMEIELSHMLVIVDDFNLPVGKFRPVRAVFQIELCVSTVIVDQNGLVTVKISGPATKTFPLIRSFGSNPQREIFL